MTHCRFLKVTFLIAAGLLLGCGQAPHAVGKNRAPAADQGLGGVIGTGKSPQYSNDLKQIGIFYKTMELDFNRPPATQKEFQDYIKKDAPQLSKWIDDGVYVIVPNVKPSGKAILAYQNKEVKADAPWVVRGDGSVSQISAADLKKELKAQ